jgi:hypothetical protein
MHILGVVWKDAKIRNGVRFPDDWEKPDQEIRRG